MAERFLSQLQTISTSELEDKVCVICAEEYGTAQPDSGDVEHPVRFDCGHVVGSECIKTWLFTGRGRNSCPHCRQKLFDLDNNHDDGNSYDGAESTDDDDSDENDASDEESEVENTDDERVDTDEYEVLGVRWLIPRQLGELDPQYGIMYLLPHDRIRITSQWHEDMGFIFGILREKGNSQLEQQWRTWSSDWIAAANRRDEATCMAAESVSIWPSALAYP